MDRYDENELFLDENIERVERVLDEIKDRLNKSGYIPGTNNEIEEQMRSIASTAEAIKYNLDKYEMTDIIASEEHDVTMDEIEDLDKLEEITDLDNIDYTEKIEDLDRLQEIADAEMLEKEMEEAEEVEEEVREAEKVSEQSESNNHMIAKFILTRQMAREMFGWIPPEQRGQSSFLNELNEMGLRTKEDIKAYMHTLMPSQDQEIAQTFGQQIQQTQTYNVTGQQVKDMFTSPETQEQQQSMHMEQHQGMRMQMQPA